MALRAPIYEGRRTGFKGVGFHYNGFRNRYYAWRYQERGSTPDPATEIARIRLKLRNQG